MGWASTHIGRLQAGETIQFRPKGNSMTGRINDGQLVTVEPVTDPSKLQEGDIVLCSVKGHQYLHLIKSRGQDGRFLISNNRGYVNGWSNRVYGRVTKVEG